MMGVINETGTFRVDQRSSERTRSYTNSIRYVRSDGVTLYSVIAAVIIIGQRDNNALLWDESIARDAQICSIGLHCLTST